MEKTLLSINASSAVTTLSTSAGARPGSASHVTTSHGIVSHSYAKEGMGAHSMENTQRMVLNIRLVAECAEKSQKTLFYHKKLPFL